MTAIIRAKERHVSDIGKLWLEFIRFHQYIDPIFTPREDAVPSFEEEQVWRLMKSKDGLVLIALDKGKAVGYSLSEIEEPPRGLKRDKCGYIYHMAVTASYRRRGIGEKMLDEIMKWFRSKSISRVELDTSTKNHVSKAFWEKNGFTDYMRKLYRQI